MADLRGGGGICGGEFSGGGPGRDAIDGGGGRGGRAGASDDFCEVTAGGATFFSTTSDQTDVRFPKNS